MCRDSQTCALKPTQTVITTITHAHTHSAGGADTVHTLIHSVVLLCYVKPTATTSEPSNYWYLFVFFLLCSGLSFPFFSLSAFVYFLWPVSYLLLFHVHEVANKQSGNIKYREHLESPFLLLRSQNSKDTHIHGIIHTHIHTKKDCMDDCVQILYTEVQRRMCTHSHSCTCLSKASICRRYIRQCLHICVLQLKPLAPAPTPRTRSP